MGEHWKKKGRYAALTIDLKKQLPVIYQDAIDATPCFGWLWRDPADNSVCGEMQCGLRTHCQNVWNQAQVQISRATKKPRSENTRRQKRKRGKYRYDSKYTRRGWQRTGYPVDNLAEAWDDVFKAVPVVEKYTFSQNERQPVMKVTASYRALVVERVIVARLWTNANRRAIVDIAPELVTPLVSVSNKLGKDHVTTPTKVPPKTKKKLHPCTHRVVVFTPEAAKAVAIVIKRAFKEQIDGLQRSRENG